MFILAQVRIFLLPFLAATIAVLFAALVAPLAAQADDPLDQQARAIAKDLQCPICENHSVADSPSELATQMRGIVREQLEAGKSRQEIEAYFVARYGEAVLRNPPKEGINLLVWGVPPVALAVAASLVVRMLRRNLSESRRIGDDNVALTVQEQDRYQRMVEQEVTSRNKEQETTNNRVSGAEGRS